MMSGHHVPEEPTKLRTLVWEHFIREELDLVGGTLVERSKPLNFSVHLRRFGIRAAELRAQRLIPCLENASMGLGIEHLLFSLLVLAA
jgi:hypothetical protein